MRGMLGKGVYKLLLTLDIRQVNSSFSNSNGFHITTLHKEILLIIWVKKFTKCLCHLNSLVVIPFDTQSLLMKDCFLKELRKVKTKP